MKEVETTEILNDIEQDQIIAFNNNTIMKEAVRKLLLWGVYNSGCIKAGVSANPRQNFALSIAENTSLDDARMGQELRAAWWGIAQIESSFNKISEVKRDDKPLEVTTNPAE